MKIFNLSIDMKRFGKIFSSRPTKKDLETKPRRDWSLLISLFFILVIVIGVSNYYIYKWASDNIENTKANISSQNFDRNQVVKVIEYFDKKQKEFDKTLNSGSQIKDPSI